MIFSNNLFIGKSFLNRVFSNIYVVGSAAGPVPVASGGSRFGARSGTRSGATRPGATSGATSGARSAGADQAAQGDQEIQEESYEISKINQEINKLKSGLGGEGFYWGLSDLLKGPENHSFAEYKINAACSMFSRIEKKQTLMLLLLLFEYAKNVDKDQQKSILCSILTLIMSDNSLVGFFKDAPKSYLADILAGLYNLFESDDDFHPVLNDVILHCSILGKDYMNYVLGRCFGEEELLAFFKNCQKSDNGKKVLRFLSGDSEDLAEAKIKKMAKDIDCIKEENEDEKLKKFEKQIVNDVKNYFLKASEGAISQIQQENLIAADTEFSNLIKNKIDVFQFKSSLVYSDWFVLKFLVYLLKNESEIESIGLIFAAFLGDRSLESLGFKKVDATESHVVGGEIATGATKKKPDETANMNILFKLVFGVDQAASLIGKDTDKLQKLVYDRNIDASAFKSRLLNIENVDSFYCSVFNFVSQIAHLLPFVHFFPGDSNNFVIHGCKYSLKEDDLEKFAGKRLIFQCMVLLLGGKVDFDGDYILDKEDNFGIISAFHEFIKEKKNDSTYSLYVKKMTDWRASIKDLSGFSEISRDSYTNPFFLSALRNKDRNKMSIIVYVKYGISLKSLDDIYKSLAKTHEELKDWSIFKQGMFCGGTDIEEAISDKAKQKKKELEREKKDIKLLSSAGLYTWVYLLCDLYKKNDLTEMIKGAVKDCNLDGVIDKVFDQLVGLDSVGDNIKKILKARHDGYGYLYKNNSVTVYTDVSVPKNTITDEDVKNIQNLFDFAKQIKDDAFLNTEVSNIFSRSIGVADADVYITPDSLKDFLLGRGFRGDNGARRVLNVLNKFFQGKEEVFRGCLANGNNFILKKIIPKINEFLDFQREKTGAEQKLKQRIIGLSIEQFKHLETLNHFNEMVSLKKELGEKEGKLHEAKAKTPKAIEDEVQKVKDVFKAQGKAWSKENDEKLNTKKQELNKAKTIYEFFAKDDISVLNKAIESISFDKDSDEDTIKNYYGLYRFLMDNFENIPKTISAHLFNLLCVNLDLFIKNQGLKIDRYVDFKGDTEEAKAENAFAVDKHNAFKTCAVNMKKFASACTGFDHSFFGKISDEDDVITWFDCILQPGFFKKIGFQISEHTQKAVGFARDEANLVSEVYDSLYFLQRCVENIFLLCKTDLGGDFDQYEDGGKSFAELSEKIGVDKTKFVKGLFSTLGPLVKKITTSINKIFENSQEFLKRIDDESKKIRGLVAEKQKEIGGLVDIPTETEKSEKHRQMQLDVCELKLLAEQMENLKVAYENKTTHLKTILNEVKKNLDEEAIYAKHSTIQQVYYMFRAALNYDKDIILGAPSDPDPIEFKNFNKFNEDNQKKYKDQKEAIQRITSFEEKEFLNVRNKLDPLIYAYEAIRKKRILSGDKKATIKHNKDNAELSKFLKEAILPLLQSEQCKKSCSLTIASLAGVEKPKDEEMQKHINGMEENVKKLDSEISQLQQKIERYNSGQKSELNKQIDWIQKQKQNLTAEIEEIKENLKSFKGRFGTQQFNKPDDTKFKNKIEEAKKSLQDAKDQIAALEKEITNKKNAIMRDIQDEFTNKKKKKTENLEKVNQFTVDVINAINLVGENTKKTIEEKFNFSGLLDQFRKLFALDDYISQNTTIKNLIENLEKLDLDVKKHMSSFPETSFQLFCCQLRLFEKSKIGHIVRFLDSCNKLIDMVTLSKQQDELVLNNLPSEEGAKIENLSKIIEGKTGLIDKVQVLQEYLLKFKKFSNPLMIKSQKSNEFIQSRVVLNFGLQFRNLATQMYAQSCMSQNKNEYNKVIGEKDLPKEYGALLVDVLQKFVGRFGADINKFFIGENFEAVNGDVNAENTKLINNVKKYSKKFENLARIVFGSDVSYQQIKNISLSFIKNNFNKIISLNNEINEETQQDLSKQLRQYQNAFMALLKTNKGNDERYYLTIISDFLKLHKYVGENETFSSYGEIEDVLQNISINFDVDFLELDGLFFYAAQQRNILQNFKQSYGEEKAISLLLQVCYSPKVVEAFNFCLKKRKELKQPNIGTNYHEDKTKSLANRQKILESQIMIIDKQIEAETNEKEKTRLERLKRKITDMKDKIVNDMDKSRNLNKQKNNNPVFPKSFQTSASSENKDNITFKDDLIDFCVKNNCIISFMMSGASVDTSIQNQVKNALEKAFQCYEMCLGGGDAQSFLTTYDKRFWAKMALNEEIYKYIDQDQFYNLFKFVLYFQNHPSFVKDKLLLSTASTIIKSFTASRIMGKISIDLTAFKQNKLSVIPKSESLSTEENNMVRKMCDNSKIDFLKNFMYIEPNLKTYIYIDNNDGSVYTEKGNLYTYLIGKPLNPKTENSSHQNIFKDMKTYNLKIFSSHSNKELYLIENGENYVFDLDEAKNALNNSSSSENNSLIDIIIQNKYTDTQILNVPIDTVKKYAKEQSSRQVIPHHNFVQFLSPIRQTMFKGIKVKLKNTIQAQELYNKFILDLIDVVVNNGGAIIKALPFLMKLLDDSDENLKNKLNYHWSTYEAAREQKIKKLKAVQDTYSAETQQINDSKTREIEAEQQAYQNEINANPSQQDIKKAKLDANLAVIEKKYGQMKQQLDIKFQQDSSVNETTDITKEGLLEQLKNTNIPWTYLITNANLSMSKKDIASLYSDAYTSTSNDQTLSRSIYFLFCGVCDSLYSSNNLSDEILTRVAIRETDIQTIKSTGSYPGCVVSKASTSFVKNFMNVKSNQAKIYFVFKNNEKISKLCNAVFSEILKNKLVISTDRDSFIAMFFHLVYPKFSRSEYNSDFELYNLLLSSFQINCNKNEFTKPILNFISENKQNIINTVYNPMDDIKNLYSKSDQNAENIQKIYKSTITFDELKKFIKDCKNPLCFELKREIFDILLKGINTSSLSENEYNQIISNLFENSLIEPMMARAFFEENITLFNQVMAINPNYISASNITRLIGYSCQNCYINKAVVNNSAADQSIKIQYDKLLNEQAAYSGALSSRFSENSGELTTQQNILIKNFEAFRYACMIANQHPYYNEQLRSTLKLVARLAYLNTSDEDTTAEIEKIKNDLKKEDHAKQQSFCRHDLNFLNLSDGLCESLVLYTIIKNKIDLSNDDCFDLVLTNLHEGEYNFLVCYKSEDFLRKIFNKLLKKREIIEKAIDETPNGVSFVQNCFNLLKKDPELKQIASLLPFNGQDLDISQIVKQNPKESLSKRRMKQINIFFSSLNQNNSADKIIESISDFCEKIEHDLAMLPLNIVNCKYHTLSHVAKLVFNDKNNKFDESKTFQFFGDAISIKELKQLQSIFKNIGMENDKIYHFLHLCYGLKDIFKIDGYDVFKGLQTVTLDDFKILITELINDSKNINHLIESQDAISLKKMFQAPKDKNNMDQSLINNIKLALSKSQTNKVLDIKLPHDIKPYINNDSVKLYTRNSKNTALKNSIEKFKSNLMKMLELLGSGTILTAEDFVIHIREMQFESENISHPLFKPIWELLLDIVENSQKEDAWSTDISFKKIRSLKNEIEKLINYTDMQFFIDPATPNKEIVEMIQKVSNNLTKIHQEIVQNKNYNTRIKRALFYSQYRYFPNVVDEIVDQEIFYIEDSGVDSEVMSFQEALRELLAVMDEASIETTSNTALRYLNVAKQYPDIVPERLVKSVGLYNAIKLSFNNIKHKHHLNFSPVILKILTDSNLPHWKSLSQNIDNICYNLYGVTLNKSLQEYVYRHLLEGKIEHILSSDFIKNVHKDVISKIEHFPIYYKKGSGLTYAKSHDLILKFANQANQLKSSISTEKDALKSKLTQDIATVSGQIESTQDQTHKQHLSDYKTILENIHKYLYSNNNFNIDVNNIFQILQNHYPGHSNAFIDKFIFQFNIIKFDEGELSQLINQCNDIISAIKLTQYSNFGWLNTSQQIDLYKNILFLEKQISQDLYGQNILTELKTCIRQCLSNIQYFSDSNYDELSDFLTQNKQEVIPIVGLGDIIAQNEISVENFETYLPQTVLSNIKSIIEKVNDANNNPITMDQKIQQIIDSLNVLNFTNLKKEQIDSNIFEEFKIKFSSLKKDETYKAKLEQLIIKKYDESQAGKDLNKIYTNVNDLVLKLKALPNTVSQNIESLIDIAKKYNEQMSIFYASFSKLINVPNCFLKKVQSNFIENQSHIINLFSYLNYKNQTSNNQQEIEKIQQFLATIHYKAINTNEYIINQFPPNAKIKYSQKNQNLLSIIDEEILMYMNNKFFAILPCSTNTNKYSGFIVPSFLDLCNCMFEFNEITKKQPDIIDQFKFLFSLRQYFEDRNFYLAESNQPGTVCIFVDNQLFFTMQINNNNIEIIPINKNAKHSEIINILEEANFDKNNNKFIMNEAIKCSVQLVSKTNAQQTSQSAQTNEKASVVNAKNISIFILSAINAAMAAKKYDLFSSTIKEIPQQIDQINVNPIQEIIEQ